MVHSPKLIRRAVELLDEGCTPGQVLKVLLKEMPDEELPTERTIRRWKKVRPRVAQLMPKQEPTSASAPSVAEAQRQHFAYMAEIANGLLAATYHPLDSIRKNPEGEVEYGEYLLGSDDDAWPVSREDLSAWLKKNLAIASGRDHPAPGEYEALEDGSAPPLPESKVYPDYDFECLMAHLKDECSIIGAEGLDKAVQQDPYAVIDAVRLASRRKTFKGKCEVCRDW